MLCSGREVYDVPMRDVFTVQEQIARSIADALNVRLTSIAHAIHLLSDGRPLILKPMICICVGDTFAPEPQGKGSSRL